MVRYERVTSTPVGVALAAALATPLVGLAVLLSAPSADRHWQHQPSHFWLVLAAGALAAGFGWSVGQAARRRTDARLFLVSLAFISAAAFLGLHALATPGVLLDASNAGFVVATPVGLVIASGFALWSSLPLDGSRARWVMSTSTTLRLALVLVIAAWAVWSLSSTPPLDATQPPEAGSGYLAALAVPGIVVYAITAVRYVRLAGRRRSVFLLAIVGTWILLAEALVAVAVSENWRISWWEWHVLMLIAFGAITVVAHRLPDTERFGDLYLDEVAGGTRELSVLFADLEDFTSFSETRTPGDVRSMLNAYFEAVLPAVRSENGTVESFIGDAIMVTFNVATAQPDHAVRAARAALGLQRAADQVARSHPEWPRFRAGVNTGVAAVGVVGDRRRRDYTVLGDVVNVAARLESLAPAGGVAIGDSTRKDLRGARVTSLGTVAVKGRTEPVDVWRLEEVEPDPPSS